VKDLKGAGQPREEEDTETTFDAQVKDVVTEWLEVG
jgi:hypothetical protein